VKTPSAKAEGFSQEVVCTTTRDPKLIVTPNCVTRASRVTSTQAVSSYSMREVNKKEELNTTAIHPSAKALGFLASKDKICLEKFGKNRNICL
jgi:hypothetical protein